MCVDEQGQHVPVASSWNLRYLHDVMCRFGLERSFAVLCERGSYTIGTSRSAILERVRSASALINVMGFLDDEEILRSAHAPCLPGYRSRIWTDVAGARPAQHLCRPRRACHDRGKHRPAALHDSNLRPPVDHYPPACSPRSMACRHQRTRAATGHECRQLARRLWSGDLQGEDLWSPRSRVQEVCRAAGARAKVRSSSRSTFSRGMKRTSICCAPMAGNLSRPRTVAGDPWRYREYIAARRPS